MGVLFAVAIWLLCFRLFSAAGNILVTLLASTVTTIVVYTAVVSVLEAFAVSLMSTAWLLILLVVFIFSLGAAAGFLYTQRRMGGSDPFNPFS